MLLFWEGLRHRRTGIALFRKLRDFPRGCPNAAGASPCCGVLPWWGEGSAIFSLSPVAPRHFEMGALRQRSGDRLGPGAASLATRGRSRHLGVGGPVTLAHRGPVTPHGSSCFGVSHHTSPAWPARALLTGMGPEPGPGVTFLPSRPQSPTHHDVFLTCASK